MESSHDMRFVHATGSTPDGRPCFTKTSDYRACITRLREALDTRAVRLLAYAILPNRWHVVAGSSDPKTTLEVVTWVARTRPRHRERTNTASLLVNLEPLCEASLVVTRCRDVERQAVAGGLAARAQDWPWCSAADRFLMLDRLPLVSSPFLTSPRWLEYVNDAPRPPRGRLVPLDDFAEVPGRFARLTQRRQQRVGLGGPGHENQPDAHVERPEHLRLRHASGLP